MSKWNRPMRQYQIAAILCQWCQKPLRATEAGWTHYERIRITDPKWHAPQPSVQTHDARLKEQEPQP